MYSGTTFVKYCIKYIYFIKMLCMLTYMELIIISTLKSCFNFKCGRYICYKENLSRINKTGRRVPEMKMFENQLFSAMVQEISKPQISNNLSGLPLN